MSQGNKKLELVMYLAMSAVFTAAFLPGCAETPVNGAPIEHARLEDGAYEGSYRGGPNKASVRVTIENGKIVNIDILQHQAWRGHIAEAAIVERIIDHQSTKVDAVSGATNSSRVIMNAVQVAIEKAYKN
jgi:uncharacterized protein with FMN-binding domain